MKKGVGVRNWPEYDRALVQRGDVTLWLTPDAISTWAAAGVGRRRGQPHYSDLAIETALTLRLPTPAASHLAIASGANQRVTSPR